jgi:hypothetical protein
MRAREPRPYLDKNKQAPDYPECPIVSQCQGRGGVSPPAVSRPVKTKNFPFQDSLFYLLWGNISNSFIIPIADEAALSSIFLPNGARPINPVKSLMRFAFFLRL